MAETGSAACVASSDVRGETMDPIRFDSFARSIAGGINRRSLMKAMGGVVATVAAGSTGLNAADARNDKCAHFCQALFPPGRARGKCVSDGARHVPGNVCDSCANDIGNACVGANGSVTCCAEGETCTKFGTCEPEIVTCSYESCQAAPDAGPYAACCGAECGLLAISPCDPENDRCCGTLNGDPNGDYCKATPDSPSGLPYRCCIPVDTYPCSGSGGNHCSPDSPCDTCCSGFCGSADADGNAFCANAPAS